MKHFAAPLALSFLALSLGAGCLGAPDEQGAAPAAPSPAANPAPEPSRPAPPPAANPEPPAAPPAAVPPVDPPAAPDPGAPPVATPPPASAGGPYTCTLVIGIASTGQWYKAGFEKLVDDSRWELIAVHSAKVELWADPKNKLWSNAPSSPCATNAGNPDRILFTGLNWLYREVDEWVPQLTASVKNLQAKYPGVKRIELRTFVRAPGNQPCPGKSDYKSFIHAAQDEAYQRVAATFPGLVTVAPKLEVRSCADFGNNAPHFSGEGAKAVAEIMAAAYADPSP